MTRPTRDGSPRRGATRADDKGIDGADPTTPANETAATTARDRAKADRRAALLAAAARLFAERGFDGVTLGDIGEAAGVSGPAVYRHVSSKQALLGAILVDVSERLLAGGRRVASDAAANPTADDTPDTPPRTTLDRRVADEPRSPAHPASDPSPPNTTADNTPDTPPRTTADRRAADDPRSPAHPASVLLLPLVEFHVAFALAEADVIRVQDRDLDRLSPEDRRTVRELQNAYVSVWTAALAATDPDAETPAERRVRALACFGLINSTPHSVRGVPVSRVRPTLTRMALAALTA